MHQKYFKMEIWKSSCSCGKVCQLANGCAILFYNKYMEYCAGDGDTDNNDWGFPSNKSLFCSFQQTWKNFHPPTTLSGLSQNLSNGVYICIISELLPTKALPHANRKKKITNCLEMLLYCIYIYIPLLFGRVQHQLTSHGVAKLGSRYHYTNSKLSAQMFCHYYHIYSCLRDTE